MKHLLKQMSLCVASTLRSDRLSMCSVPWFGLSPGKSIAFAANGTARSSSYQKKRLNEFEARTLLAISNRMERRRRQTQTMRSFASFDMFAGAAAVC